MFLSKLQQALVHSFKFDQHFFQIHHLVNGEAERISERNVRQFDLCFIIGVDLLDQQNVLIKPEQAVIYRIFVHRGGGQYVFAALLFQVNVVELAGDTHIVRNYMVVNGIRFFIQCRLLHISVK